MTNSRRTATDAQRSLTDWRRNLDIRLNIRTLQIVAFATFPWIAATGYSEESTNRDAAIQFLADSVGTECTQEVVEKLGLPKEQCDQRHTDSVAQCKDIAATDLPTLLSQGELGRAMLRFSLCRGMVIQGKEFDLTAWAPTITRMLAKAGEGEFLLNFDLNMKLPDGSVGSSIQLQGIRLSADRAFHGADLGKYDYFLTVSGVEGGHGRLTIEFYEYETRKKVSDVVSELVAEVDFQLSAPAVFEGSSNTFGIDLAFSISSRRQTTHDQSD